MDTQTSNFGVKDWLEATKDMKISGYIEGWTASGSPEHEQTFTRRDFEKALGKVSRRRQKPAKASSS